MFRARGICQLQTEVIALNRSRTLRAFGRGDAIAGGSGGGVGELGDPRSHFFGAQIRLISHPLFARFRQDRACTGSWRGAFVCASAVQSLASGYRGGDAWKAAGRDEGFKGSDEEEGLKEDPSEFPRVPGTIVSKPLQCVSHFFFLQILISALALASRRRPHR